MSLGAVGELSRRQDSFLTRFFRLTGSDQREAVSSAGRVYLFCIMERILMFVWVDPV